jgi:hypothetical protein
VRGVDVKASNVVVEGFVSEDAKSFGAFLMGDLPVRGRLPRDLTGTHRHDHG